MLQDVIRLTLAGGLLAGGTGLLWRLRWLVLQASVRLQLLLRLAAWAGLTLLVLVALDLAWPLPPLDPAGASLGDQVVQEGRWLLAVGGALLLVRRAWGGPAWPVIGVAGPWRMALADVAVGLLLGPLAVGFLLLAGLLGGWIRVVGIAPLPDLPAVLGGGALLFALVGLFEELTTRGCLTAGLARVVGWPLAVFVSTALFAGLHAGNPGFDLLALGGVAAAGLVFAFALYRTGALWLPIAFHASWDWAETALYGFPNSGLPPTAALRLALDPAAPAWLTGSAFGPEASLLALGVLGGVALLIAVYSRGRPPAWSER